MLSILILSTLISTGDSANEVVKVAYWDEFDCGTQLTGLGDDWNASTCGSWHGTGWDMGCPSEIVWPECPRGTAILSKVCGNSQIRSCENCYYWYAEYECLDYSQCRWQEVRGVYFDGFADSWWAYAGRNLNKDQAIMKCVGDESCTGVTCRDDGQWCRITKGTERKVSPSNEVSYVCVDQLAPNEPPTSAPTWREVAGRAYWDEFSCGPDGDDHNWNLCKDQDGSFKGCPYYLPNSECPHNQRMVLDLVEGNGQLGSYNSNGCLYYFYTEYLCETASTFVWNVYEDMKLGSFADQYKKLVPTGLRYLTKLNKHATKH